MLTIKLQRIGKKHQPSYRIVVAEKRSKMIAPPVEDLGFYHPVTKEGKVANERVAYWMARGAKPTTSVHNILIKLGALTGAKIKLHIAVKKATGAAVQTPVASR